MEQEKLYGIYPGNLTINMQNQIKTLSEENTFKLIYYIESEIFWAEQEDQIYTTDIQELAEKYFALDYVIYSTSRFNINFDTPTLNRLEQNDDYINWYNTWNKIVFNPEQNKRKLKR